MSDDGNGAVRYFKDSVEGTYPIMINVFGLNDNILFNYSGCVDQERTGVDG